MAANMGSMRILIKGGKVVNDDFTQEADVYIENGIIQQVTHINTQYAFYFHIKIHLTQIFIKYISKFISHPLFFRKAHSTVQYSTHTHSSTPHVHWPVYPQLLVWLISQ